MNRSYVVNLLVEAQRGGVRTIGGLGRTEQKAIFGFSLKPNLTSRQQHGFCLHLQSILGLFGFSPLQAHPKETNKTNRKQTTTTTLVCLCCRSSFPILSLPPLSPPFLLPTIFLLTLSSSHPCSDDAGWRDCCCGSACCYHAPRHGVKVVLAR